jgi:competence protein ComGC
MQTDVKIAQESGEEHAPMNLSRRSFNDGAEMHGCAKSSPPTGCHIAIIPRLHRGFTVVQLLTILPVIAVLAAMMVSVFSRGLATARHSQCDTHLKDLTIVLNEFRTENGHFPKRLMDLRSKGYIQDDSALHCPADPAEQSSYGEYYAIRASRDGNDRPILVCPYHELDGSEGMQAFKDRQTQHGKTMKAQMQGASDATVQRPGQEPIPARRGMEVHGGDIIRTGSGGSATIVFADGSSSELRGGSSVTVMQSFQDGRSRAPLYTMVRQKFGDVLYKVIPGSRFDVVTLTATTGAMGTEFRIQTNENGAGLLTVVESTVYVSTLNKNVTLPTGAKHLLTGDRDNGLGRGGGTPGKGDGPGSGNPGRSNPGD